MVGIGNSLYPVGPILRQVIKHRLSCLFVNQGALRLWHDNQLRVSHVRNYFVIRVLQNVKQLEEVEHRLLRHSIVEVKLVFLRDRFFEILSQVVVAPVVILGIEAFGTARHVLLGSPHRLLKTCWRRRQA